MEINGEDLLRGDFGRGSDKENNRRKIEDGKRNIGGTYSDGDDVWVYGRASSNDDKYADSIGGGVYETSDQQRVLLIDSAIRDDYGNLITFYHYTTNLDFEKFDKGDIGFHFGTESQAFNRAVNKKRRFQEANGRLIEAYLTIKNPWYIGPDQMGLHPERIAHKAFLDGIINEAEYKEIKTLEGKRAN